MSIITTKLELQEFPGPVFAADNPDLGSFKHHGYQWLRC